MSDDQVIEIVKIDYENTYCDRYGHDWKHRTVTRSDGTYGVISRCRRCVSTHINAVDTRPATETT